MIEFDHVSVTYDGATVPVIAEITASICEGELCVVVGPTGSGKSTLLRTVNGLVPHFSGGTLAGEVRVNGRSTQGFRPRDLADVVGFVVQDPASGFVASTVEDELAFSMESLALEPSIMRRRVEETLDLLGLADLRSRSLETLSGGEAQRVAIGAALTANPRVLVLDEPTSALDPGAAEEVLAAIARLVHDLGVTVLMAEHRLERVASFADRILLLTPTLTPPPTPQIAGDNTRNPTTIDRDLGGAGGTGGVGGPATMQIGLPGDVLATSALAPPVVQLGRELGWAPVPVSIRDARRHAFDLRDSLAASPGPKASPPTPGPVVLAARAVVVTHGSHVAVRDVSLDLHAGERVALMGRNGSGKSSLLWALQGTGHRDRGTITVTPTMAAVGATTDPAELRPAQRRRLVGLVPQEPGDLLYLPTVGGECAQADRESAVPAGTCAAMLARIVPGIPADRHPRDLSEGQRIALVLAITLTAAPGIVLLDEPTRGLDQTAKDQLIAILNELTAEGRSIVLSTHDVEFAARFADRVVVLAGGEVVSDGAARTVLGGSPMFAPQVAKILAPTELLTVDDVVRALAAGASA